MDKPLAQEVLTNLNTPKIIECLEKYAQSEIDKFSKQFEGTKDKDEMLRIQGAMRALRRLMNIRDDAIAVMGVKNGSGFN